AAARGAGGVRAHLLRAAARARAEQHEPRRRARRARADASLPQAQAAQHPLLPPRRRPRAVVRRIPMSSPAANHDVKQPMASLMLGAIGIVFGDIGTSPLYT